MNKIEILNDIEKLKRAIILYHQNLNIESIWLFLATMGCFSVYPWGLKFYALLIVTFLFTSKIFKFKRENIPFEGGDSYQWHINNIKKEIDERLCIELEITECMNKLKECENLFSLRSLFKKNMTFLFSYIFSILTFLVFLIELIGCEKLCKL